jgi:septation ring formation regulator EzrA
MATSTVEETHKSYERLLQALQDMKNEIAKQMRPVEEQIIQANVDHLRQAFSQEHQRLSKCLEEIDDNIQATQKYLEDYERIRSSLFALNEKLTQLGADPIVISEGSPTSDLGDIMQQRIEKLRSLTPHIRDIDELVAGSAQSRSELEASLVTSTMDLLTFQFELIEKQQTSFLKEIDLFSSDLNEWAKWARSKGQDLAGPEGQE